MISSADAAPPRDITWRRADPGFILVESVRLVRGFLVPLIVVVVSGGGFSLDLTSPDAVGTWLALTIGLIGIAIGTIQWRLFAYALAPDRLLVHSGWIARKERAVPYRRIQSVDLVQTPLLRVLGLSRVSIQTAVGGSEEDANVEIKAVREADARDLRARLIAARDQRMPDVAVAPGETDHPVGDRDEVVEPVYAISTPRLFLAGATSGAIGPAAALIAAVVNWADDILPDSVWNRIPYDRAANALSTVQLVVLALLIAAILAWTIAILGTMLTYYGFRLVRDGEHLRAEYGLLDRNRVTIPVARIQAVRIDESLLRQPFGYASLSYESAGRTAGDDQEEGSGFLCPFLPRRDIAPLLRSSLPAFVDSDAGAAWQRPPRRAATRFFVAQTVWMAAVPAAFAVGAWRIWGWSSPWELVALLLPVSVAAFGWWSYRDTGWQPGSDLIAIRSREIGRRTTLIPRRRLQFRETRANPFQRRAGLATVVVAYARGGSGTRVAVPHLDADEARDGVLALGNRQA